MAKDFEMGYLLDFYGEVLTPKQREMLNQYYNDDLSLSEIGENFGITRQGARDAIKHGETTLKELEAKVGFAGRYRRLQEKLEEERKLSCFYRAVKQLPGAKREICLLKIYEGLNNQEIAHRLNIPVGTVKNYYTQSIQLLKYYLKELY